MGFSDAQMDGRREGWRDGWMHLRSLSRKRGEPLQLNRLLFFIREEWQCIQPVLAILTHD